MSGTPVPLAGSSRPCLPSLTPGALPRIRTFLEPASRVDEHWHLPRSEPTIPTVVFAHPLLHALLSSLSSSVSSHILCPLQTLSVPQIGSTTPLGSPSRRPILVNPSFYTRALSSQSFESDFSITPKKFLDLVLSICHFFASWLRAFKLAASPHQRST